MILEPMLYRPTFYRIYKSKSTEGFQSVPYVVALFSAMLWIFYALIKSNETFLITINAAGCVIETIYIVMYFVYAPKKAKLFTAKIMLLLNVGVFGVILLVTLLLFKGDKRVVMLGWICVGFSVSVFVAPLSIMVSTLSMHGQMNPITLTSVFPFWCVTNGWHACTWLLAETRDPNEERGVHAVLPLPLAHPQRCRLVPLWPPHQRQIRRGNYF
jgi:uncharacterized protein with PQ loop repeat